MGWELAALREPLTTGVRHAIHGQSTQPVHPCTVVRPVRRDIESRRRYIRAHPSPYRVPGIKSSGAIQHKVPAASSAQHTF
jgi:hypothetical protein